MREAESPAPSAGRPRVVAIVQARMGSSRLPGKVLELAAGRTLLEHVLTRLKKATTLDDICVATTEKPADDPIDRAARELGFSVFRGSEDDVLGRYLGAAEASRADVIVRITADCPLMDPAEVDRIVSLFLRAEGGLDYAANQGPSGRRGPLGLAVEAFTREALERSAREGHEPRHREHVTPYLYEAPGRFRTALFHPDIDRSALRLTVDTPDDLALVRAVLTAIEHDPEASALETVARFLDRHPEVRALNADVRQKSYLDVSQPGRASAPPLALFRADASVGQGTGHVMRSLAAAEAWRRIGGEAKLLSADLAPALAARLRAAGVETLDLGRGIRPGSAEDVLATRQILATERPALLYVDGYTFTPAYMAQLRADVTRPEPVIAYVDDHVLPGLPVHAIINPNAGVRSDDYAAVYPPPPAGPRILAGASYALLRSELRDASPSARASSGGPRRLLITFGGTDPARLSLPALRAALALTMTEPTALRVTALVSRDHPDLAAIEALAAQSGLPPERAPSIEHEVKDMVALLSSVDLALTAAGSTCWELARMGVPMLVVIVAENQLVVERGVTACGAARSLGRAGALTEPMIAEELQRFVTTDTDTLEAMSRAGMALIDGQGAGRIARALNELVHQDTPFLSPRDGDR